MEVASSPDRMGRTTGQIIEQVLSEIENESIAKLSPLEYLQQHLEIN
jgi:hypothetical protein